MPYFVQDVHSNTEDAYATNRGKLLDYIRQLKGNSISQATSATPQFPKIILPKFSGAYSEWPTFRDLFESMVKDNTSINPIDKLHYFKTNLVAEPAALLSLIPVTGENFVLAWERLTDRYEIERLLTTAQISNICGLLPISSESSAELMRLFNGTVNAVGASRNLGRPVDGYDVFFIYLTVQKFDKQSRRKWEAPIGSKKKPSTFRELQEFLKAQICTVQAIESVGSPIALPSKAAASSAKPKIGSNGFRIKWHQVSSSAPASKRFSLCKQNHYIAYCDAFPAKSINERRTYVLANNLCLNYLGLHFVRECRSQKTCQVCRAKHHTMLHDANWRGSESNPVSSGNESKVGTLQPQPPLGSTIEASNENISSHNV